jgi:HTH-type transcriptional regulator, sugar sensing transcriptional regulator
MDISGLKEAGLTEGEIKVYLALLEIGSSTTGPIIEKSCISRSIVYQILEKLMQKGLVSKVIKEKTNYFQATEPNKILEYIDRKEKGVEENRKKVENLLPELLLKQKTSIKSETNMYFGFEGIKTAVSDHLYSKLKKGEEFYCLGVYAFQQEKYHNYWQKDHRKRIKAGVKIKIMFNKNTGKKILENRNSFKGCDARYMPTDVKTPAWFLTYKDTTTIILQHPTEIAVEIINQDIADSFQAYFNEFWKKSKPFKKQKL